jgi:hypothetical protein
MAHLRNLWWEILEKKFINLQEIADYEITVFWVVIPCSLETAISELQNTTIQKTYSSVTAIRASTPTHLILFWFFHQHNKHSQIQKSIPLVYICFVSNTPAHNRTKFSVYKLAEYIFWSLSLLSTKMHIFFKKKSGNIFYTTWRYKAIKQCIVLRHHIKCDYYNRLYLHLGLISVLYLSEVIFIRDRDTCFHFFHVYLLQIAKSKEVIKRPNCLKNKKKHLMMVLKLCRKELHC